MASRRFGKYEVLARLATGGAANIFLARQPGVADFHKLVCLKTLLPERAEDADFVAMFLDEARLAARLNHPNCVQIYDLGRVRGSYYISMEYIFGETLWNLLATVTKLRTALPAPHVAAILAAACDGLHHAHELKDSNGRPFNLVHRDVSPQNVMITFEGQTKVVDFGIAKAETGRDPTMAGIVKGKFSYMSPEQITGGAIDRRSDVYSLGIVLFECLASRRLYRGDTPEDIARLILEHRAPRLRDVVPDIPPALDVIVATALARHPSKRYQTALEMGEALRDYLDSVRYNHSAAGLARLVEDRFRGQIPERRKVYESALAGSYDEKHLLEVLDAYPARDIDLFPEQAATADTAGDFIESSQLIEVASALARAVEEPEPLGDTLDGEEATGDLVRQVAAEGGTAPAVREASGWRVELHPSDVAPAPISVLTQAELPGHDRTFDEVATRIEPEELEQATAFDPKNADTRLDLEDAFGDATEGPGRMPPEGPTSVELGQVVPAGRESPVVSSPFAVSPFSPNLHHEEPIEPEPTHEERTALDADAVDRLELETGPVNGTMPVPVATPSSPTSPVDGLGQQTAPMSGVRSGSAVRPSTAPGLASTVRPAGPGAGGVSITRGVAPRLPSERLPAPTAGVRDTVDAFVLPAASEPRGASTMRRDGAAPSRFNGASEGASDTTRPELESSPLAGGNGRGGSLVRPATSELMAERSRRAGAELELTPAVIHGPLGSPVGTVGATPTPSAVDAGALAEGRPTGRFGVGAVIAALVFGILLGLAGGFWAARAMYAAVEIPVTVEPTK